MTPNFFDYLNIILTVGLVVGGFFALRRGYSKEALGLQEQTINALRTRLDTLEKQAESDARELARLRQILATVRHALKRRGLHIEIDGEYVTLVDADGNQARSTQVPPIAKVQPVKLQPIDPDDAI